jgi:hypothetical protein
VKWKRAVPKLEKFRVAYVAMRAHVVITDAARQDHESDKRPQRTQRAKKWTNVRGKDRYGSN